MNKDGSHPITEGAEESIPYMKNRSSLMLLDVDLKMAILLFSLKS
jgi:hypothetical protein